MSHSNLRNILFPVYSSSILKGNKEFKSKGVCTLSLYLGTNENSFLKKKKRRQQQQKRKPNESRDQGQCLLFFKQQKKVLGMFAINSWYLTSTLTEEQEVAPF